jgi:hypothetical protein
LRGQDGGFTFALSGLNEMDHSGFQVTLPGSSGTTTRVCFWLKYTFAGAACVPFAGRLLFDRLWTSGMASRGPGNVQTVQGPGAGAAGVAMVHNIYVCAAHRVFREILKVTCF